VRSSDFHDWHHFCQKAGGEYDPRFYPLSHLVAFLNGQEPPLIALRERLSDFTKGELVALAQMVVKRGAPPLDSRGRDLNRYWADELRDYLELHSSVFGEGIAADGTNEALQGDAEIEVVDGVGGNDDLQSDVKGDSRSQKAGWDEKSRAQSQLCEVPDSD